MLKALRRVISKYVYIKFIESLLMTKKSTRARLDQPVNRTNATATPNCNLVISIFIELVAGVNRVRGK